jgi:TonB-linked SusC/RagA family outer membrane protein
MYQEAWENDGRTGTPDLGLINVNMTWQEAQKYNTNWVDDVIQTGYKQNYNITAGYTNKWFGMKSIVTYDNNESFLAGNNYQRLSGRVNTDYKPLKGLNISLSNSLSRGINRRVDAAWAGGLGSAMSTMLPIFPKEPLLNSNGIGYRTPVGLSTIRDLKDWRSIELRSINNLNLNYEVTDDITLNGSASYDYMDYGEFLYEPQELIRYYSPNYVQNGVAKWFPIWTSNMNYYLTANWNKKITPDHGVNVMLGHEYQQSRTTSKSVENLDATGPTDKVAIPDTALRAFGRTPYEWAFLSYFGRANYKFKNKFNVQVTGRVDGSSRFGRNNRYGFFPAAAVGYILSDEEFIKRHDWISFLKVKVGIGKSGNASFDNYARWGTITPSGNLPQYNGQPMLAPARLENQNLRWESTRNFDATLEGSLFKNRISFELTYYDKATKDVILDVTVPRTTGFFSMYDNVGGIINRGVEFVLKSKNIQRKNFQWNTDFNIARNYNEITSIGVYSEDAVSGGTNDTRVVVGYPVGTNFLVRFSHIDQATGLPVYLDKEGKETKSWDPANRVPVGDVLPEAIGSLNNSFSYKNWDLTANIYYSIGGDIYESSAKRQLGVQTVWNSDPRVFDRWQKPGDDARYPRRTLNTFTYGSTTPWINTTQWLEDGSYVRLRSLSVGYRLPSSVAKKYNLDGARIAFIATNLLTWTNYTGLDPEIARDFESPTDRNMSGSITYLTAPQEKSYSISLSVNF